TERRARTTRERRLSAHITAHLCSCSTTQIAGSVFSSTGDRAVVLCGSGGGAASPYRALGATGRHLYGRWFGLWLRGSRNDLVEYRLIGQRNRRKRRQLADAGKRSVDEASLDDGTVATGNRRDVQALHAVDRAPVLGFVDHRQPRTHCTERK